MMRQPKRFTVRVPSGKFRPVSLSMPMLNPYLVSAPSPPPSAMAKSNCIICWFSSIKWGVSGWTQPYHELVWKCLFSDKVLVEVCSSVARQVYPLPEYVLVAAGRQYWQFSWCFLLWQPPRIVFVPEKLAWVAYNGSKRQEHPLLWRETSPCISFWRYGIVRTSLWCHHTLKV